MSTSKPLHETTTYIELVVHLGESVLSPVFVKWQFLLSLHWLVVVVLIHTILHDTTCLPAG